MRHSDRSWLSTGRSHTARRWPLIRNWAKPIWCWSA
jgi:hypothetical protein